MTPDSVAAPPLGNRILQTLSRDILDAISPFLTRVRLERGQVLIGPSQPPEEAYFVESGIVALIAQDESGVGRGGAGIAAGLVGPEGVVGCPALADMWTEAFHSARVQQAGQALRIRAELLRELAGRSPELHEACWAHIRSLMVQVVRTAAHSARHTLPERCAHWLLTAHDRVAGADLHVTHEILASMLGVRRAGVTVALTELQASGLIQGDRGRIKILDRAGLRRITGQPSPDPDAIVPLPAAGRGRGGKLGVFAVRLRAVRAEYGRMIGQPGLGMRDFADLLGVEFTPYERLEAALDRPSLAFLVALHRRTGISIGRRTVPQPR